jgi:dehydrogenase/reductase SDR family protein 12
MAYQVQERNRTNSYMISLHETIDVQRPLVEAFDYIADFRTTTQWDSTADSARKITSGPLRAGTRFEVVCRHPLGRITLHYTLTRYEPGRLLALHGSSRFFDVDDEIRFTETGSGTRIDYRAGFTFRQPLKYFSARFRPGLERMGRTSVQGLKLALDDAFPPPTLSRSNRLAQRLVLPAIAQFTRSGYNRARKTWLPVSRWMGQKHVLITGASSGLGLATAQALAEKGAKLTLVIRDESKALALKQTLQRNSGNNRIHIEIADLSLMADVDRLTQRLNSLNKPIDVLVNNAGALFNPHRETIEGLEQSFALLLLSPYRLTRAIKPLLIKAENPRVINVVSGGMYSQRLSVSTLEASVEGYSGSVAYARAKRALMVVTQEWAREWAGENIVVNAMHPGWAQTPGVESSLPTFHKLTRPILRTPQQGADTIIWLAMATEAGKISGKLFLDREPRTTHLLSSTQESIEQREALVDALEAYGRGTTT